MTNPKNLNGKMWWTKFSFKDYEADIHLRLCSLAAQGLWMRMLCIMNAGTPYGYLSLGGQKISEEQLSRLAGCSFDDVKILIKELENKGIFSRDQDGAIYNRRMVRDQQISKARAKAGAAGGRRKTQTTPPQEPKNEPGISADPDDFAKQNAKQNDEQKPNTKSKSLEVREESISKTTSLSAEDQKKADEEALEALRKQVWEDGKKLVSNLSGKPDREAGKLIGAMVRDLGQDLAGALAIIREADRIKPMDVVSWLQAAVRARRSGPKTDPKRDLLAKLAAGIDFDDETHKNGENAIPGVAEDVTPHAEIA